MHETDSAFANADLNVKRSTQCGSQHAQCGQLGIDLPLEPTTNPQCVRLSASRPLAFPPPELPVVHAVRGPSRRYRGATSTCLSVCGSVDGIWHESSARPYPDDYGLLRDEAAPGNVEIQAVCVRSASFVLALPFQEFLLRLLTSVFASRRVSRGAAFVDAPPPTGECTVCPDPA